MGRILSEDEWAEQLRTFEHTAFRLEQQPAYCEPSEKATIERFVAGDPEPPDQVPGLQAWFAQVAGQVAEGKRVERVRINDDPPTPQQKWERWIDPWNTRAGEVIRYLDRARAHEIGLLPAAGDDDWWLLDSCRLVVMRFELLDDLLALQEEARTQRLTFKQRAQHGQAAVQRSYRDLVRDSTLVRHFETVYMPGLLQVPGYARHVLAEQVRLHGHQIDDVDAAVADRMQRQQYLYDTSKRFEFILCEPVLRWLIVPAGVMHAQLNRPSPTSHQQEADHACSRACTGAGAPERRTTTG